jgi:hypothetical protein
MSTLAWIVIAGLGMSALALVGAVTVFLSAPTLTRVLLPIVGLAAGSLLGGAFFHMLPESVDALGNELGIYPAHRHPTRLSRRASIHPSSWLVTFVSTRPIGTGLTVRS